MKPGKGEYIVFDRRLDGTPWVGKTFLNNPVQILLDFFKIFILILFGNIVEILFLTGISMALHGCVFF